MLNSFCILLCLSYFPIFGNPSKSVEKNGMKVYWELRGEELFLEMSAPIQGWIAVGFNEQKDLAGTHLIMGHVADKQTQLSDRFILKPGIHKAMEDLGAHNKLRLLEGKEHTSLTRISFLMPLNSDDSFHKDLVPGSAYFLLLAYSREDDFGHHSIMRTSVKIIL